MNQHDHETSGRRGPGGLSGRIRIRRPASGDHVDDARLERLSAYLDGWTTDRERSAVERELAADPAAREVLDGLRLVRTALANLEAPRSPRSFALAAAPVRYSTRALFRRLEWAMRGAAGVAAFAFAVALVRAPQVTETVIPAVATAVQEAAAAAPTPAQTQTTPSARETATQTLNVAPASAPAAPVSPAGAGAPSPTAGATTAAAPAPTAGLPAAPAAGGTAVAAPRTSLAPAPSATPEALAAAPATPAPTAVATVEATRLAAVPPPTATSSAPVVAVTSDPARTPESKAVKVAGGTGASSAGTTPPATASNSAGETDVAPALGVLALLLVLLATIQRIGGPPHDGG